MPGRTQASEILKQEYPYGFVTDVDEDAAAPGLNEQVIRWISEKKAEPDWMLEWRLRAYRQWLTMTEPTWANVHYPPIDYQAIRYYSAPKRAGNPKNPSEIDPELLRMYEKLGIPLQERKWLAGVAVDAVFDSVSVATTFRKKLEGLGIYFLLVLRGRAEVSGIGSADTWDRSFRTPTIFLRRLTPQSSATAPSSMCRRASAARWNSPRIFGSTRKRQGSSSARSSSPKKEATSAIWKAARRRCAIATSCMPPSWSWWR